MVFSPHFILEERIQMVETQSFLPEAVFKASGHVQKFTDLMVKDEETGACYRADHLLRDKDLAICSEDAAELKHIIAVLDALSVEEVGAKINEYGIVAPDTKNPLSDPYPFNLMFSISDSTGPSYMSPETAHGIFIGFKHLYKANRKELPFAAGQVAKVFRNEISPKQKLLRLKEFKLVDIKHFVDPKDKSHLKFSEVSNLELFMLPTAKQKKSQQKDFALSML